MSGAWYPVGMSECQTVPRPPACTHVDMSGKIHTVDLDETGQIRHAVGDMSQGDPIDLTLTKPLTVEITATVKHSPPPTTLRTPDLEPLGDPEE